MHTVFIHFLFSTTFHTLHLYVMLEFFILKFLIVKEDGTNRVSWASPLLLANEKKPLCGEKSRQLVRWMYFFFVVMGKLENTVKLGRWTWTQRGQRN